MDLRVTERARLKLRGLVVEGRRAGGIGERCCVATQAEQVDVAHFQHMRIGRAVRRVAGLAAFHLHDLMLEDKWPLLVRVASETHGVLRGRCTQLVRPFRAMRIVTVGALDQPFIYAVVERHRELRLLLQMARIAKFRLRLDEQELCLLRVVRRVA